MLTRRDDSFALRDRLELAEEENRQLKNLLAPAMSFSPLGLTGKEGALLGALYQAAPAMLSRDRLFHAVYAFRNDAPEIKIIDVFITRIRQKLRPRGMLILTHWGEGYAMDRASAARLAGLMQWAARGEIVADEGAPDAATIAPRELSPVDIRNVKAYASIGQKAHWIACMTGIERPIVEGILDGRIK